MVMMRPLYYIHLRCDCMANNYFEDNNEEKLKCHLLRKLAQSFALCRRTVDADCNLHLTDIAIEIVRVLVEWRHELAQWKQCHVKCQAECSARNLPHCLWEDRAAMKQTVATTYMETQYLSSAFVFSDAFHHPNRHYFNHCQPMFSYPLIPAPITPYQFFLIWFIFLSLPLFHIFSPYPIFPFFPSSPPHLHNVTSHDEPLPPFTE